MTGICYPGTVGGFKKYASREIQKAAMRGWSLRDPKDVAKLQQRLRAARARELRDRVLRTGGDVA